jgi:hypothetical protein
MRRGEGAIRVDFGSRLPQLPAGPHSLRYRNTHRSDIGVYLANALIPTSDRVAITAQRRDTNQHELTIEYLLRGNSRPGSWYGVAAALVVTLVLLAMFIARRRRA